MKLRTKEMATRIVASVGAFIVGVTTSLIVVVVWPFVLSYIVYKNMDDDEGDNEDENE